MNEKDIHIRDMSDDVDEHENLDQLIASGIHSSRGFWRYVGNEIIGNKRQITVNHADWDMRGEHVYPIFAQLMDNGFENISVQKMKDVDDSNSHYEYEVAEISIAGFTSQRVSIDGRALFREDDRTQAGERKSAFGLETDVSMIYNSL